MTPFQAMQCLVCSTKISKDTTYLGIDVCRACSVFYRRNARYNVKFTCKYSGERTNKCVQEGRVLRCRRCRFEFMKGIFERAGLPIIPAELHQASSSRHGTESDAMEEEEEVTAPASTSSQPPPDPVPMRPSVIVRLNHDAPSTSSATKIVPLPKSVQTPVLDRIRSAYEVRSRTRKLAELCLRKEEQYVQPMSIYGGSYPIIPATQENKTKMRQIEQSSLLHFAHDAFNDFRILTAKEKWELVSESCDRVGLIESTYRSAKMFPGDERVEIELRKDLGANVARCKQAMRRFNPTEEEFLVLLALSFWNSEIPSDDGRLSNMAAVNRTAIMHDLHTYYSSRGRRDYSTRIGDLYYVIVENERVSSLIAGAMDLLTPIETNNLSTT